VLGIADESDSVFDGVDVAASLALAEAADA
jgi:hypothetical protein